jgi:hypothetical protein
MNLAKQMQNPQQMLQRMGVPQEHLNSPQDAMKYLMDSGRVNQGQIDQMNSLLNQFKR